MKRKFTATERKLLRKDEEHILANIEKLPAERRILADIAAKNRRFTEAKKAGTPEVGIFWLLPNGDLMMDGTPISEAEGYGDLKIHGGTHTKLWDTLQRNRLMPADVEYEEYPRGRVAYNTKARQYWLFADACILKNKAAIRKIMNDFKLPSSTKKAKDEHYRCPGCIRKRVTKKQEEDDWDI